MNGLETRSIKSKLMEAARTLLVVAVIDYAYDHEILSPAWLLFAAVSLSGMVFTGDLLSGIGLRLGYPERWSARILAFLLHLLVMLTSWVGYAGLRIWVASGGLQRLEDKLQTHKTCA